MKKKEEVESEIVKLSQISQTPVIFMYLHILTVLWPVNLPNVMTSEAKYGKQPPRTYGNRPKCKHVPSRCKGQSLASRNSHLLVAISGSTT